MAEQHQGKSNASSSFPTTERKGKSDAVVINPFATGQTSSVRQRVRSNPSDFPLEQNPSKTVPGMKIFAHEGNKLTKFKIKSLIDLEGEDSLSTPALSKPFLEMESSPSSTSASFRAIPYDDDADLLDIGQEPLKTSSGLLLTHRKTPTGQTRSPREMAGRRSQRLPFRRLEVDTGVVYSDPYAPQEASTLWKAQRMLTMFRCMIVLFAVVLVVGTGVIIRHSRHEERSAEVLVESEMATVETSSAGQFVTPIEEDLAPERIILVPLQNSSHLGYVAKPKMNLEGPHAHAGIRRNLRALEQEFEEWIKEHNKNYHSDHEKKRRFDIWLHNHDRTIKKNERHGRCTLTKKHVFGSNMFKDLTPEEFQSKYLTGYRGPRTDQMEERRVSQRSGRFGMVLDAEQRGNPIEAVNRHPKVQKRYIEHWEKNRMPKVGRNVGVSSRRLRSSMYAGSCSWYDISCWLKWILNTYGYNIGGTMEPGYDADTYPSAIDWRDVGTVTDVHSQGNCGACWAITAVETVESAYAISSGKLLDLAETEVITCDDTCEMCNGGWPQNAYEYVVENNGLPLENDISYDGDFLLAMTNVMEGTSDELSEDDIEQYKQSICPSGGGGGGNSHSGSQDSNNNYGGNSYSRYAKIKGYGYATDRCICYTDGTGCDCDEQNERLAVMNVATYGPATVCLEASLWQDYAGGIITSELGCSSAFLDMNHCVQTVGYAYTDVDGDGDDGNQGGSNSHSGSGSGSQDDGNREGYWIIRNQWSSNWGMNGYAYVAMGENTCGVLNDMTQAYM